MLPVKLMMHYFGPYEDETVDFGELSATPVFLVSGNTGSGKTTIFDAMCYALFGQTTNDHDRDASAMRSDFAPSDQETRVTFVFEHQGVAYQITRKPAQNLLGKRGRVVSHAAKVRLIYPLDRKKPHEITKIKVADDFIEELLNMTRDQFKQIVLLPQGKFRQFLVSSSSEKEELLRDLFNTELYERWAQNLKARLADAKKHHQTMQTKLSTLQERVTEIDGDLTTDEWLSAVQVLESQLEKNIQTISREINKSQDSVNYIIQQKNQEEKLIESIHERQDNTEQLQQLVGKKPEISLVQQRLDRLDWYRSHQEEYLKFRSLQSSLDDYQRQIDAEQVRQQKLHDQKTNLANESAKIATQADTMNSIKGQASVLVDQLPQYAKRARLTREVQQQKKQVQEYQNEFKHSEKQLGALQSKFKNNQQSLDQFSDLSKRQVELESNRHQLQDAQRMISEYQKYQRELTKLSQEIAANQQTLADQEQVAETAKQEYMDLKDAHARSEIANLVQDLKPGTPCPVCGSLDHPHPSKISQGGKIVSNEEVERANQRVNDVQEQLTITKSQIGELRNRINELKKQAQEVLDHLQHLLHTEDKIAGIKQKISALSELVNTSESQIGRDEKRQLCLQKEQARLESKQKEAQQDVDVSREKYQSTQLTLTQHQTALQTILENISGDFEDEQSARDQLAIWQKQVDKFEQQKKENDEATQRVQKDLSASLEVMTHAREAQKEAHTQMVIKKERLTDELSNYSSELDWQFWRWAEQNFSELHDWQNKVQEYQNKVSQVKTNIQRLDDQINGRSMPNIKETQAKLQEDQGTLAELQQHRGQVKNELSSIQDTGKQVSQLNEQQNDELTRITDFQTISDVMNGNTDNKLSLERYVLQSYLSDVLHVANERLNQLTNGRYAFKLSDDQAKGNGTKWSGLEINVYDDNAGQERSARTLSGGESFIASLALALGLGKVIQERSGGIQVDALFVDEGFGSLDQEALNQALNSLQSIHGYRMIGIISHVTELESQVPNQLRVVSRNGVSHVRYQHEISSI